ncbi:hypothetical protein BG004_000295, partial [Podila humilis]
MQSAGAQHLARSKSNGLEKKAPPPIRPKPTALVSPPTSELHPTSSLIGSTISDLQQRPTNRYSGHDTPAHSFGDLRKTFERQPNSNPFFEEQRSSLSGNNVRSTSTQQTQQSPTVLLPASSNSNRPRSLSSPAPPHRDSEDSSSTSGHSTEGIDDSQPEFGNLRARFQSQASLSSVSLSKPEPPRPKPKPKPSNAMGQTVPSPQPPRMSLDSSRFSPQLPSASGAPLTSSRLSTNSLKQIPRPPPKKQVFVTKTPTPPRTPTPPEPSAHHVEQEDQESKRNPFMASDEDEPSSPNPITLNVSRPGPKVQYNPLFQQLNARPLVPSTAGKAAFVPPPMPQRASSRSDSPQSLPPKLPSRSNSALLKEDSPEEIDRKHRQDKRRRVVQELLETEISFSKDMLLLQEVYVTDMAESSLFTPADEKIIFTNLGDVISLTLDFVALLTPACGGREAYDDSRTFVGDAFIQMISQIRRVYSEYCKRQEASAQHLQELDQRSDLKLFFDACTEKCKGKTTGWDLASLLIKPVQRVLKYPLLINQIHSLTSPDHADYDNLAEAQKDMLDVAEEINEIKKRKDIVEKIVGSKKKSDSDFARTTQQLRQAVGGSEVTVDILFEALLEKFNLQQRLIREFVKHIQNWLISIKQFFDTQEVFALYLLEIYSMVPIHRNDEISSIDLVKEYHKSLSQFSKTIGRELEGRLKKTVYRSIEQFLKLFSGPLQVMKKREKKLLDYDNVRGMKERGDTVDKNMLDSASAYTAINEQLVDELPKFLGLTTQYFDVIVMEFSKVQMYFYAQVRAKNHEFFVENIDSGARDIVPFLGQMNIFEDYAEMMIRPDGPVERMERVSLLRNVYSDHVLAFDTSREQIQKRKSGSTLSSSRSRSSSSAPPPLLSNTSTSWSSKSASHGALIESPSASEMGSLQSPLQPRYYPGEDENPFEIPESIFQDEVSEEYEPFGPQTYSSSGARPISSASSYSYKDYNQQQQQDSRPPALDEGLDDDEIGIAQALFECTSIYPYQSQEARQLNFDAGESIIVFGLNENGWYFGKKVENRLCRLIVREHFGPIVEKVTNVLIRKGRMPVGQIARITELAPKRVRECLFVLIQHNIAVYAEATEKTRIVTYYEVNRPELLNRVHIPQVLHSSQQWFESEGTAAIKKIFTRMVKEKCLIAVRPSDSLTGTDRDMAEEKRETDKLTLPPTAAELAVIR